LRAAGECVQRIRVANRRDAHVFLRAISIVAVVSANRSEKMQCLSRLAQRVHEKFHRGIPEIMSVIRLAHLPVRPQMPLHNHLNRHLIIEGK
jgi:hypothetical protein